MTTIRILSARDIARSLTIEQVTETVESVYRAKSSGDTEVWPTVFHLFEAGNADLDIKSGLLKDRNLYGHKTVSWFGANEKRGLPTLYGLIAVYDATTGMPVGIVEGASITGIRTGAAGALGIKHLARKGSENLLIVGAGNQAAYQIAATLALVPAIRRVRVFDRDAEKASSFIEGIAARLSADFGLETDGIAFSAVDDLEQAVAASDAIITVTSAHEPVIKDEWVKPGTHFSCIGADMTGKQEIESALLARARILVDDRRHCIDVGEIEVPLKQGAIAEDDIAGELGDVITGAIAGRTDDDQITVFDATGMALLDIATAELALRLAEQHDLGTQAEL